MPKYRSIFLSDIHLGTRSCQAERLVDFLRHHESEYLYLLGDIVDFWAMSRAVYWSPAQNTVIQKILKRARHGACVVFVPGNHDEALREYVGVAFGDITIAHDPTHVTADGKRYWLVHGDEFDQVTRYHQWLTIAGDRGYAWLVRLNEMLSWCQRHIGVAGHWSLSQYVRSRLKSAIKYIHEFEGAVARHAATLGVDGVICGHIHAAAHKPLNGIQYLNCGDWVDSCTAVLEANDGRLALATWDVDLAASNELEPMSLGTGVADTRRR